MPSAQITTYARSAHTLPTATRRAQHAADAFLLSSPTPGKQHYGSAFYCITDITTNALSQEARLLAPESVFVEYYRSRFYDCSPRTICNNTYARAL